MSAERKTSKALNIILWITQALLALIFVGAGLIKVFQPGILPFPWVKDSPELVLITGFIDFLAGIGIIVPTLLNIRPKLTIYAGYGTILLMVAASIFHIARGEAKDIGFNIFTALAAVFIVWGRQTRGRNNLN